MTDEREDLENPWMSDLLEQWGRQLHSGRIHFEPPVDRTSLKASLDDVDREIQDSGRGGLFRGNPG